MAMLDIFAMFAALPVAGLGLPPHQPTRTVVPAQAFVRILPAARVSLGPHAEGGGRTLTNATITVEDGTRRPAKLVEFQ